MTTDSAIPRLDAILIETGGPESLAEFSRQASDLDPPDSGHNPGEILAMVCEPDGHSIGLISPVAAK